MHSAFRYNYRNLTLGFYHSIHSTRTNHPQLCRSWGYEYAFCCKSIPSHVQSDKRHHSFDALQRQDVSSSGSAQNEIDTWMTNLDALLPSETNLASFRSVRDISSDISLSYVLSKLLRSAKNATGVDLLFVLGIDRGRWRAVAWIVKHILIAPIAVRPNIILDRPKDNLHTTQQSLDTITSSAQLTREFLATKQPSKENLDGTTSDFPKPSDRKDSDLQVEFLGSLWQTLGKFVLTSAASKDQGVNIMTQVRSIIAHLHHVGAIPDTIYKLGQGDGYGGFLRPPTLALLSSRILASLSDASWREYEQLVMEEAGTAGLSNHHVGHDVRQARHQFQVRDIGHEIWLELILWCCVDGGYYEQAASILSTLMTKQNPNGSWRTIDWDSISNTSLIENQAEPGIDCDILELRQEQSALFGNEEGYSSAPPVVNLGLRSISSEVVKAISDGLFDTNAGSLEQVNDLGAPLGQSIELRHNVDGLLARSKSQLSDKLSDQALLRAFESYDQDMTSPWSIGELASSYPDFDHTSHSSSTQSTAMRPRVKSTSGNSLARFGMLQQAFRGFLRVGDLYAAHRILEQLISRASEQVEFTQGIALQNSALQPSANGTRIDEATGRWEELGVAWHNVVPEAACVKFLGLITEAEDFELAKHIFHDTPDWQPQLSQKFRSPSQLQAAVLRLAAHSLDGDLLAKLLGTSELPLAFGAIRALLIYSLRSRDWTSAVDLVHRIGPYESTVQYAEDVMLAARVVLELTRHEDDLENLKRAKSILLSLLRLGHQTHSQSVRRSTNMLAQIMSRSSPELKALCQQYHSQEGRALQGTVQIPTSAFNIFLRGIVETNGSVQNKWIWDLYCGSSTVIAGTNMSHPASWPKGKPKRRPACVRPNITTVRIFLRQALSEERDLIDAAGADDEGRLGKIRDLLAWAKVELKSMGFRDDEIEANM